MTLSIKRATDALAHRGPDDEGIWFDSKNSVYFGHRRLSIIDLSQFGHQPMVSYTHNICIVFNGEIYNYLELKKKLESKGYKFKGHSDTEVLLTGYVCYGRAFIEYLRGMFAFAIWDGIARILLLVRDRAGKKPLYYFNTKNGLFFASEINALRALLPSHEAKLDMETLDSYLTNGAVTGNRTIFKDMKEVPPATAFVCKTPDQISSERYWQINWGQHSEIPFDEAVEKVEHILTESVRLRLRSDVPVGVFLSGGIDSGLITAIAARSYDRDIQTFCIGFDDAEVDERNLAKVVAEQYGTKHTEIVLRPNILSVLPKIAKAYGEPFADPSAIPSFLISQFVAQHTKVVLNGDGGDELFCGYRRHVAAKFLARFRSSLPPWIYKKIFSHALRHIPVPQKNRTKFGLAYRFLRALNNERESSLILSSDGFDDEQKRNLYRDFSVIKSLPPKLNNNQELNGLSYLESIVKTDFESGLPDILLVKMDIASMAHGLEARSPILDQELISLAFSFPNSVRLPGITTKPLLRELSKKYLPNQIIYAPKRGFEIPLVRWLQKDLSQMRDDIILTDTGLLADLFKRSYLESLIRGTAGKLLEPKRWANLVWMLLMLGLWDEVCWNNTN
jgi:asparagine synthase (glutamine-hydrolysing)